MNNLKSFKYNNFLHLNIALAVFTHFAFCTSPAAQENVLKTMKESFNSVTEKHNWIKNQYLPELERYQSQYYNVPRGDGKILYNLVVDNNIKNALEMGSANGYSAIWTGMGLEKTSGQLLTIEINSRKAKECSENIQNTGLQDVVTCIQGDALHVSGELSGDFDFFFFDLGPVNIDPFYDAVKDKLTEDVLIVLHNLNFMHDYRSFIEKMEKLNYKVEEIRPEGNDGYGFAVIRKTNT
jgi:predicted O-methyltransferase YrrM